MVSNVGDADLHVTGATSSDPQFVVTLPPSTVVPGGSTPMDVVYTPTSGAAASGGVTVMSDASNGAYVVSVLGRGNTAPQFTPPLTDQSGAAFVLLMFDTPATDAEGDLFTFSAMPLPVGATYDTNTGHFEWTPGFTDGGTHPVAFSVSDGIASSSQTINLVISADNRPPVANPGGPYHGAAGQPLTFDGSGSSDPDGNALTYDWAFGDGGTGTGVAPTHTYALAGIYLVSLTVTDVPTAGPALSNSATTTAGIQRT